MGGGSADAAATLRLLARAPGLGDDDDAAGGSRAVLGADVPAQLRPGRHLGTGAGERARAAARHRALRRPRAAVAAPAAAPATCSRGPRAGLDARRDGSATRCLAALRAVAAVAGRRAGRQRSRRRRRSTCARGSRGARAAARRRRRPRAGQRQRADGDRPLRRADGSSTQAAPRARRGGLAVRGLTCRGAGRRVRSGSNPGATDDAPTDKLHVILIADRRGRRRRLRRPAAGPGVEVVPRGSGSGSAAAFLSLYVLAALPRRSVCSAPPASSGPGTSFGS